MADDRAGLERLLPDYTRPAFASEPLAWDGHDRPLRYTLTQPRPSDQTEVTLTPPELLDRLAERSIRSMVTARLGRRPYPMKKSPSVQWST